VRLVPLTDAEYAEFAAQQVLEYADQLSRAGEVAEKSSVSTARERLDDLLADRLRDMGHEFLGAAALQDGVTVGWMWLSPAPAFVGPACDKARWLSQVTVSKPRRGQGWGRAILVEAEHHLALRGVDQIWLRVFDWNVIARHLYESLGYELVTQFSTDAHLRKYLARGAAELTP
jgi:ribosomal protein S18 acetylase RimI-like enzyme